MKCHNLLTACQLMSVDITREMADCVKRATRDQGSSKLWFKYCTGMVTASKIKSAFHTDPAKLAHDHPWALMITRGHSGSPTALIITHGDS